MKAKLDQRSFEDAARNESRTESVARVLDLMAQGFTYKEISVKMGKE